MITFDEMRRIAAVKSFAKVALDSAKRTKSQSTLAKIFPVVEQLFDSIITLTESLNWFINLIERETRITCSMDDIEMAERLELVKRGQQQRNWG
jgi:hypothetical protein